MKKRGNPHHPLATDGTKTQYDPKFNVWLLLIGPCFGLIAAASAQTVTVQSGRFALMIDQQSIRLSSGETTLLECRGIELVDGAGKTLPVEYVSVVKEDNGALQILKAGDALIERKFMPVDGGFRVEEHFKKRPSSALNRWNSSYAPGFAGPRVGHVHSTR